MTFILGTIQLIAIIVVCIYELRKKSIAIFMWSILFVMFGIMHFISILTNSYTFSEETMNTASLFVILFTISYLLGRILISQKNTISTIEEKNNLDFSEKKIYEKFMKILLLILIFSIIIRMIDLIKNANGSIFNTSWETMRKTGGKYFSLSQFFMPIYLFSSSCLMMAIKVKNKKIIIISSIIILFEVLISRNRIEILPLAVSIIYYIILKSKRIKTRDILKLVIISILGIYAIYGLRVFRHAGTLEKFFKKYDFISYNETVFEYLKKDDGELGLRNYMYYFIERKNEFTNFNKGHTYIRMLFGPIPTQWSFGLKPPDFSISMGQAVNPKIEGFSVHPTLFGDVYANFGMYGFVFGVIWAILLTIIDKQSFKKNKIIFLPFIMIWGNVYIIQARGSVYNGYIWGIYATIYLYLIWIIFRSAIKTRKHEIN